VKHEFAYEEAQRHLKQRNRFAALSAVLGLTSLLAVGAAATREESVILVPVTTERLTLGSGGTDAHYLELVTRDTALMLLNRAPESLDYWMEQVLKVADPSAHGSLAYIPGDDAALKFDGSREWASYTYDVLEAIADKARLPARLITATAKDVVARFDDAWSSESGHLPFPDDVRSAIERHRKTLAI